MKKIKILIVEDDKRILDIYDKFMSDEIFEKELVSDGKTAVNKYKEFMPEIIILDIMLPDISGYVILKEIRTALNDKKTCIIMATSISKQDDVLSCVKLGISGYMVKPFNHRELNDSILTYFEKDNQQKALQAKELLSAKQAS